MALSGSFQDHHLEMFRDTLDHELQQKGSLLLGTVRREKVGGVKNYFDKLGKATSYEKTGRNQIKVPQTPTFERRQLDFQFIASDILVDVVDVMDMVGDPKSDYVQAMKNEIGREIDDVILTALSGSATVIANGSSSSTALPAGSKVAVSNHDYDSGSGDVALTVGKLKKALALLGEDHVDVSRETVYCVAPMAQLMNLATEAEVVSRDYRSSEALETKGAIPGLNGYLGITFIAFENTGTDSNADELAYVYPESAIKVGIRKELTVTAHEDFTRTGNPTILSAFVDLGAVRMFEEKVIQIACNPL